MKQVARETPSDLWEDSVLYAVLNGERRTYRERLDRPRRNVFNEVIPRIVIVRNNIRRLGKVKPKLP
jgi:hypothetical protein